MSGRRLGAWSDAENEIFALAYLNMLALEQRGEPFNKAAIRREGLAEMAATRDDGETRSSGSWEFKCMNASAMLRDAKLQYIKGYKPCGNWQASLAPMFADIAERMGFDFADKILSLMETADE